MPKTPRRRSKRGLAVTAGVIGMVLAAAPAQAGSPPPADPAYLCGIEGCNHNQVLL